MVEGARRQKTPNEIALGILLVSLTALFLLAVFTLPAFAHYSEAAAGQTNAVNVSLPVLISLLVCLIPTTIGGLLSAIGISGIDRLVRRNVLATSGRAVEAAGDIDVLLLDKTGTITLGNRMAVEFHPAPGVDASSNSPTPRNSLRSPTKRPKAAASSCSPRKSSTCAVAKLHELHATFVPFTAQTRMSGVDFPHDASRRSAFAKARPKRCELIVESAAAHFPEAVQRRPSRRSSRARRHAARRRRRSASVSA